VWGTLSACAGLTVPPEAAYLKSIRSLNRRVKRTVQAKTALFYGSLSWFFVQESAALRRKGIFGWFLQ
jgi:hypothetical protein